MRYNENFTPAQEIAYYYKQLNGPSNVNKNRKEYTIEMWWNYIATQDKALVKSVIERLSKVERRLNDFCNGLYHTTKIRKYCSRFGYSDVHPFEVVRVISENCVEVRALDTVQINPEALEFHIGGFAAHCSNQHAQRWEYISNPENKVFKIRKSAKGWERGRIRMYDEPYKFYDFNF